MFTGPLPEQVNHRLLAKDNRKLQGTIPLGAFERLAELMLDSNGEVQVKLEFRKVKKRKTLVVGTAETAVSVTCQHCLNPMEYSLRIAVRHLIVQNEEDLFSLGDDEDGIISDTDMMPLTQVLEDELIVNLPMTARHSNKEKQAGACNLNANHENDTTPVGPQTHRPFSALADLKNEFNRS